MKWIMLIAILFSIQTWAMVKFPIVSQVSGTVKIQNKDGKWRPLKNAEILRDQAHISTDTDSQVRIELDENSGFVLLASSRLELPLIDWDTGSVAKVFLKEGTVRGISNNSNKREYMTPVTKDPYTEVEFLLGYEPSLAKATITILRGGISFRGWEHETSMRLEMGQKASFQGQIEGGEPVFDVLLKGRKVARGSLSKIEKVDAKTLAKLNQKTLILKPKRPAGSLPPRTAKQICDQPYGELNECVWTCVGNPKTAKTCLVKNKGVSCVRRKCNANGEWSDPYEYPAEQSICQAKPQVRLCDY